MYCKIKNKNNFKVNTCNGDQKASLILSRNCLKSLIKPNEFEEITQKSFLQTCILKEKPKAFRTQVLQCRLKIFTFGSKPTKIPRDFHSFEVFLGQSLTCTEKQGFGILLVSVLNTNSKRNMKKIRIILNLHQRTCFQNESQ